MAYNDKVVKKVLDDFDKKYKSALSGAEKRKDEVHAVIPGIYDLDKKLSETYTDIAKIIIGKTKTESKIKSIKEKNGELQKKRKTMLKNAGYTENYTEPVYECGICEDSGYNGEAMCICLKKALAAESVLYSGLGRVIKNQTFENFNLNYYDKKNSSDKMINESPYRHMKSIYEKCKKFTENFGSENTGESVENFIFIGSPGRGKTHLSSAIGYELIKKGFDVFYDSAQNILYSFEKERFSRSGNFDSDIIEKYMKCDLLIIDDLGTEYSGNMSVSSLFNLINMRLLDKKNMIISTNLTGSEIKIKYDERIASRIFGEFTPLNFIGDDIRLKKTECI